jgi:hypothetical protein
LKFTQCSCIFASISTNSKLGKQSPVLETLKPIIFKKNNENAATKVKIHAIIYGQILPKPAIVKTRQD